MDRDSNQHKGIITNIKGYAFILFITLLPLNLKIQPVLLVVLFLTSLIEIKRGGIIENYKRYRSLFLPFLLLFLWLTISLIWTDDVASGIGKLERRVLYVLGPLLFLVLDRSCLSKAKKFYVMSNAVLCVAGIFYLIFFFLNEKAHFIERTISEGVTNDTFTYLIFHGRNNFIFLDIHRTYFCLSLLICILLLFFSKEDYFKNKTKYLFLALFSLIIFLLQAKITVFLLVGLLLLIFFKEVRKVSKSRILIFSLSFVLLISLGGYLASPRLNRMFKELSNDSIKTNGSLIERIEYTQAALRLVKESPIIGHGVGDVEEKMKLKLKEITEERKKVQISYDPHNEFLKVFIASGLIGFLLLMAAFIVPVYLGYGRRNWILIMFVLMLLSISLVEPLLSRQMGIFTSLIFLGILASVE